MRRTQHLSIRGLLLPVAALIALTGCPPQPGQNGGQGYIGVAANPSPIMVADGSMIVRTYSAQTLASPTLTISGGHACAIIANGVSTPAKDLNWIITSKDTHGTISTADKGVTVVATSNTSAATSVPDDLIDGQGAEFQVAFTPASLSIGGKTVSLDCGKKCCRIKIDYKPSCN